MVSYDYDDRLISLENDRKQMQTRLENLQYAMTVVENQMNNNCNGYKTQIKELNQNFYFLIIGFAILILYVNH
jgi:hypothetical protein